MAKAAGCDTVVECSAEETGAVLKTALESKQQTVIICKCESGNAKMPVITLDPVTIRDRFMAEVAK